MTRIFVLTNHKGGVGKSTSATNIAFGITGVLHRAGAPNARVLLIDTDSQGHATLVTTDRNNYGADDSLYTVLMADRQAAPQVLAHCIVPSTWDENLHVLPASPLLEGAERELMGVAGAPYRLADPLSRIVNQYAAVVIDTRPSFSLMTEMGLLAATDAIVPVEPRYLENGRLIYLSGRSIQDKKHYNPPRDLIGERRPYYNHAFDSGSDYLVIVEGQADAISFAEWGIPALALGGMQVSDDLLTTLRGYRRVFVALDNTDDAREQNHQIGQTLGGRAYLPQLPDGVKDANEWLAVHHATANDAQAMLNQASSWLINEVERVSHLEGLEQEDAIRGLFQHTHDLDALTLTRFKTLMAGLGIQGRAFNELLKASQAQNKSCDTEEETTEVFSDNIPVLSPALGFSRGLALVTVSLRERTKNNRLNVQPYLVTSTRELVRLKDQQILTIHDQEIALRVIPEGSEFLMRWRYNDIQRFLKGDEVQPGDVFRIVHDLFTTYIDFRSPVESRVLTLWTIGTYFYTLFPAYPYLALNGPKNSGKSTVLRVLQPLAFNMISTSDPTGPAMFRLIYYTSCTVGIDEAERYHNPRDPGMQQIRQLLNSGYKDGMPAIRLTGEDMKPQAFDVYSPKILAAIVGLEDILASRCILIPMRRTDQKMPFVPPDFDGTAIRHQLYVLALTHFQPVYANYFERSELYTLHNRSGELWSHWPLSLKNMVVLPIC